MYEYSSKYLLNHTCALCNVRSLRNYVAEWHYCFYIHFVSGRFICLLHTFFQSCTACGMAYTLRLIVQYLPFILFIFIIRIHIVTVARVAFDNSIDVSDL